MTTHRTQPPEHNGPPPEEAEVINLSEVAHRYPRETDVPVEQFLLSAEGRAEMDDLYKTIDSSGRIIRTISFKVSEMVEKMLQDKDPDIYSLFIHDDGAKGLTRLELIDLYRTNPLVNATMRAGNIKHHQGDFQAQEMYTYALRIFMNMVRYEWLLRTYDPSDPRWEDRASRLGDFYGNEMHVNLQPGTNRALIIPRRHTPSDFLKRPLT
jgi:hypothetical protein